MANKLVPATAHGIKEDYPLLFEISENADFNERHGFYNKPLDEEIATVMYELWLARVNAKERQRA